MAMKLYKVDFSPPARAAMMACELFNVPVEFIDVNLLKHVHLQPEFTKKNPIHTVPVLEDGDITLHDSHAIIMYLADTYSKNEEFYPKDVKQRALVNQILLFDTGVLFIRLFDISFPALIEGVREVTQKKVDRVEEAYGFIEQFLTRTKYIAADHLTIADISVVATLSTLNEILPVDSNKYPKSQAWLKEMQKYDFYQKRNAQGVSEIGTALRQIILNLNAPTQ